LLVSVTSRRRLAAGGTFVLLWLLLALVSPARVMAHAEVVGIEPAGGETLPAAPAQVRLRFSEPVERGLFVLVVYGPDGSRADRRDARVSGDSGAVLETTLRDAGAGTYSVVWRALSIDGHVIVGVSPFSIGAPGPAASAAAVEAILEPAAGARLFAIGTVLRWLTFLAAFILVGGFGFGPLVLWPVLRAPDVSGVPAMNAYRHRRLRFAWWAAAALLGLSLASLLYQAMEITGLGLVDVFLDGVVGRLATQTRYGTMWLGRLVLLLALFGVLALLALGRRQRRGRGRDLADWVGLAFGALLLLSLSASGHAAGVGSSPLAIGLDWLHMLAGALWIGGLIQLGAVLVPALAGPGDPTRAQVLGRCGRRFSWLAGTAVAVLAFTGIGASLRYVPDWTALSDSMFGAALSTKLLLIVPLLALGGAAFWRVRGRLPTGVALPDASDRSSGDGPKVAAAFGTRTAATLSGLVRAETGLALLVLAATGVLTGLPPATVAPGPGRPFAAERSVGGVRQLLTVVPNTAGLTNRITLTLQDPDGRPAAVQSVKVTLTQPDRGADAEASTITQEATGPIPTGHVPVSVLIPASGRWRAEVQLRGSDGAPSVTRFDFVVGQGPGTPWPTLSPLRILGLSPRPALTLGVLALGLMTAVVARRTWQPGRRPQPPAWSGPTLLALGIFLTVSGLTTGYQLSRVAPTPLSPVSLVPPTTDSRARGALVYQQSCLSCHGVAGRGDGPAGRDLRPPPADLAVHMIAGHTDQELYAWVTDGLPGTQMPGFADRLTDVDRWNVVNYIRQLGDIQAVPDRPAAPPP
jgi:copper transport protein